MKNIMSDTKVLYRLDYYNKNGMGDFMDIYEREAEAIADARLDCGRRLKSRRPSEVDGKIHYQITSFTAPAEMALTLDQAWENMGQVLGVHFIQPSGPKD